MTRTFGSPARRTVLKGLTATAAISSLPLPRWSHASVSPGRQTLTAKPGEVLLLDPARGEGKTAIWGYDGIVPGPLLRYRLGETVRIRLENRLPQPTAVHWHGIAIDNAMDGVAGLTQTPVAPGESFDYTFTPPHPGTYWYHTHNRSWEQLARGLYGMLVIEEPDPPEVDDDLLFVLDDWRLTQSGQIHEASFGDRHDWAHEGRLGNWLTVNGIYRPTFPVLAGDRIRFRLANTANARIFTLDLSPHSATLIALDGHPLTAPEPADGPITLAPGQRADLIIDMDGEPGSEIAIHETGTGQPYVCARFTYGAADRRAERRGRAPAVLAAEDRHPGFDLRPTRFRSSW